MPTYADKRDALISQFKQSASEVRLGKDTSNLFRDRSAATALPLNVRSLKQVIAVDTGQNLVEVEGMTPYVDLVDATLQQQCLPCVVPQLKSISIGGAISGIGIESSSFKYGLVHESVLEMEVLTGTGEAIVCTPDNEHCDLFYGLPNSYGTLGYILRLKATTIPAKAFVKLEHSRHADAAAYFDHIGKLCSENIDFLDGVMFQPNEYYITTGTFTDDVPYQSDYTHRQIYYQSIRHKEVDYLTARDYIWRWDTDWFWCSKNVGAQHPMLRPLFGRKRLNSIYYTKLMRWNAKWGITGFYNRARGIHTESVIQDVDIPIDRAHEFYRFFDAAIGIRPVWICPIVALDPSRDYPLYPLDHTKTYVNFGFWDVVRGRQTQPEGHFNKLVEAKVAELGGIKSLYSDSYYDQDNFWGIYNQEAYQTLKHKYDPNGRLKNLYDKCVLKR